MGYYTRYLESLNDPRAMERLREAQGMARARGLKGDAEADWTRDYLSRTYGYAPAEAVHDDFKASFWRDTAGTLGDIGKFVAPALAFTGVGTPLAMGIGAASTVAGRANDRENGRYKPFTVGSTVTDALKGAATSYGAGQLGKATGAAGLFGGSQATPVSVGPLVSGGGGSAAQAGAATPVDVTPLLAPEGVGGGSGVLASLGEAVTSDPLKAGELALGAYGAYGEGKAEERRLGQESRLLDFQYQRMEEEERRRRETAAALAPFIQQLLGNVNAQFAEMG